MADLPLFQQIKLPAPKMSTFDLSYSNHLTTDFGRLTPILVKELMPADEVFELGHELCIRTLPLATPVFGRIRAYVHGFFVPNRIMWDNWQRFISGWDGITVADQEDPIAPFLQNTAELSVYDKSLYDYLGIPVGTYAANKLRFLGFRFNAYQRIYDEWYRDENLESTSYVKLLDGLNSESVPQNSLSDQVTIRYRAYKKDYFTSALPWPQRGEQMTFPLGTAAPVKADPKNFNPVQLQAINNGVIAPLPQDDNINNDGVFGYNNTGVNHSYSEVRSGKVNFANEVVNMKSGLPVRFYSPDTPVQASNLYADLQAANVLSVNEFRRTMALQRWLETNARGGSRYNETLYAHFGVKIPDYRINRSQYLGGAAIQFNVDIVSQTAPETETSGPLGALAGNSTAYGYVPILDSTFYPMEHGILMCLLSIMPDNLYFQGLDRHFTKFDKFDYAWPEFAHLGEQEVMKSELYLGAGNLDNANNTVFGYQSRFAEDKYSQNEIHGSLVVPGNMDMWTTARRLSTYPTLGNTFIKCTPSGHDHIFADQNPSDDHFIVESYNHFKVKRALPVFGTPE